MVLLQLVLGDTTHLFPLYPAHALQRCHHGQLLGSCHFGELLPAQRQGGVSARFLAAGEVPVGQQRTGTSVVMCCIVHVPVGVWWGLEVGWDLPWGWAWPIPQVRAGYSNPCLCLGSESSTVCQHTAPVPQEKWLLSGCVAEGVPQMYGVCTKGCLCCWPWDLQPEPVAISPAQAPPPGRSSPAPASLSDTLPHCPGPQVLVMQRSPAPSGSGCASTGRGPWQSAIQNRHSDKGGMHGAWATAWPGHTAQRPGFKPPASL